MYDIAIIGSGVSGLGAALYSGRFELKTVVIGDKPGGTIILTNDIANYPGFNNITGFELSEKLKKHVKDYNVDFKDGKVTKVEKQKNGFVLTAGKEVIKTKSVIFATGTEWRKLNVPGEKEFSGRGVHYCALCDGAFYKEKVVAVVGGSDSAAKEALLLTEYAKKVYIIYRGDKIRPEPINEQRVEDSKKIEVINNTNIIEIKGDKTVKSVTFDKAYKGSKEFNVDGIFVDIGHIPLSGLAKDLGVKLNDKGEIIIDRECNTIMKGVFAAGDVCNTRFKQAITGVAEGVTAAYSAYHYLKEI
ncbi:MAG: FAD-dependent oxidoreductase [Nanoarchaeota archaeon]|nr:FAD-dependent oxidoreductase [Nanoarchaeota archaeon]